MTELGLDSKAAITFPVQTEDIPVEGPCSTCEMLLMGAAIPPVTTRAGGTLLD